MNKTLKMYKNENTFINHRKQSWGFLFKRDAHNFIFII